MSTRNPDASSAPAADPHSAQNPDGPHATIEVEHLLGPDDSFRFSVVDNDASKVTVEPTGEITVHWGAGDTRARLIFTLKALESGFLDGIVLGWRGAEMPIEAARSLTYRAVAPPVATGQAPTTLVVELDPNSDTYAYTLHVGYPDGSSYRVDPKIYNEGDGGPPPGR
jgi:hypothetical protein